MKFLSATLLMTFLISIISCVEEDEYILNEKEQKFRDQQQINNVINKNSNDSIITHDDTIRASEETSPCVGWDCQWINKTKK